MGKVGDKVSDKVRDKFTTKSRTQIMKVDDVICVADFCDLCPQQVRDFVGNLFRTLSQTSRHVEMVCVHDFPHREVFVKVGVMEFGPYCLNCTKFDDLTMWKITKICCH